MKLRIISFIILIIYCTMFLSSCSILDPVLYETHLFKRSSEQIYKIAEKSVGEIVIYDIFDQAISLGTCFVYSSDGKLITNYHVIEDAYSATVTIDEKDYVVDKILSYDPDIDLAIIKINATNLTPLSLSYGNVSGGEKVYAVGSSKGLTMSFTSGVVASSNRTIAGVRYIQHDAAISNGNSGGPLMNEYGEVIGINTMYLKEGQNINFAIATSEIKKIKYNHSIVLKKSKAISREIAFNTIKNYVINRGTYNKHASSLDPNYILEDYDLEIDRFITDMYPGENIFKVTYNKIGDNLWFFLYNENYRQCR